VLQIPRAQAGDAGRYTCVAVNEAGEDSIHYDVRVLGELFPLSFSFLTAEEEFCGN